jgi:hypothetical protein
MKRKINILAQYFENYNVGPEGLGEVPHWKPKGGHVFQVQVDYDWLMYADSETHDAVFTQLVANQSNEYEKYEYRDFELAPEISEISFEEFQQVYKQFA